MEKKEKEGQEKLPRTASLKTADSMLTINNREENKLLETQHKLQQALDETRLAEAEFSSAFEYAPIGMMLINIDGEIFRVNKSLCQLLGYSDKDLLQFTIRDIIYPEDLESSMACFEHLIADKIKSFQEEKRYLTKKGNMVWAYLSISLIKHKDGSPRHFVVQLMDITEKKKAADALKESEQKALQLARHYKFILDSQSVYIIKIDNSGRYSYVNDYYLREFGFTGDLVGRNALENILPEDLPACIAAGEKCLEQPEIPHQVIFRKRRQDGQILGGKWELKGILDQEGKVGEILCVGFDITEQLENLEKTRHLLEVSSEQNVRLQSFAYIISHNIRSHAANFSGLLSLLNESEDENEKMVYTKMLKSSADQLEQTIRNLNEIIAVQENVSKPRERRYLKNEIEKTLQILNGAIMKYTIDVQVLVSEDVEVYVIPAYLDSILLNLISNAIKYRATHRPTYIHIQAESKGKYTILSVSDNGLGLDLKRHGSQLFGMYKKFHHNEDARGFGLYITKSQIEAMGGKIEVESEVGIGSTFKVYLNEKN
ncbi:PAS domain S-box protein [Rhodocytophaga rosea]|uniref:histidine kinase n=1 Tax=Rhodocytophaga rosea TaxID=2704465 RepID=A0A6C0GFQ8_9BACT|nr:HAMP domain-containing sensor histidine kinase [Rhodocytophaga rosea]QHT66787.1 PAS domain S-box protein [Rhodocytophaga rosea]